VRLVRQLDIIEVGGATAGARAKAKAKAKAAGQAARRTGS
jgi:hypothetical protein